MARTITAAERGYVGSLRPFCWSKFEVQNADGTYIDYTTYLKTDWFTGATISESIDQSTMLLNAVLLKETGTLSLSPFRSDSLVNRNAGGSYATAIDAWRKWKLSVAVTREGYPPTGSDWKEMCQGRIDVIEWSGDQIIIMGRGEEAVLIDFWIAAERQYGSGGGIAMETTIQSMIDDNLSAGVYTLTTPVSPGYNMNTWTQPKGRLFPATTAVSDKAGDVIRFRYDSSNVNRLTLFAPNRSATPGSEVWTLGPAEYTAIRKIAIDKTQIANFIKIKFAHLTLGTQTVISPYQAGVGTVSCAAGVATFSSSQAAFIKTSGSKTEIIVAGIAYTVNTFNGTTGATLIPQLASGGLPTFSASAFTLSDTISGSGGGSTTSINRFGRNDLEIDLAFTSQVTDPTKAQGMADNIRSDTEFPPCEMEVESIGLWFVQLHDYGRFLANGVDSDTDLYAGVTSIRHEIANATIKTTLGVRGKPSGKYMGWRYIQGAQVPSGTSIPLQFAECLARITASTATTVTVTVTANPASPAQQVQYVGVTGGATLNAGTAAGTWVTPNGTNNVWVFNRGAFQTGVGQAQFRAGNTNSFQNDDDFVSIEEQGRDTVYLATRARVLSVTATTVVVRVAVADPYPQGSNSVSLAYLEQNTGAATSPTSPQLLTPAATLTEGAGTYADFTITRPAFGTGSGRVTFTATASGRVTDSDAVDVEEVGRDTVYLTSRARVTSTTPTTVVVRYAVADPYPQGAASVTITYQDLGSGGVSPSSGGTITPVATLTEAAGTYIDYTITRPAFGVGAGRVTFTASAANRTTDSDAVDIPEADRDTVPLISRARVTGNTATTLTVRVAVADPYPQGAASATIAYSELGLGGATTPATGQTVTPAATLTEAAGTYVDYTVTRPAFGVGAGRITFTVTAANRTSDSDAVDVPEVDRDTVELLCRAKVQSTSATQVVFRVAVADPATGGSGNVSVAYTGTGVGTISPSSPQSLASGSITTDIDTTATVDITVNRAAFGAGTGRITFTATRTGRAASTDSGDVPTLDRDTQSISVRVLRISETADQVVVRVEAITPNAGATVTVNYDAGGLTVSPSTGGTFSATTSFGTTNHIDYTITRDTQGGSPRRVAFTVSASGFIDGTDGVDVPPNSTRERCKVVVTGSPTQASGTTPTRFDNWTESGFWDIGGLHDDATNPSRFTIPAGGNQGAWLLHASMAYQANVNGDRAVYIHKNGTAVASCVVRACAGALNTTVISAFYFDNAPSVGDYYEVFIWQNSGSTLGVGGGTAEEFFSIIHLW